MLKILAFQYSSPPLNFKSDSAGAEDPPNRHGVPGSGAALLIWSLECVVSQFGSLFHWFFPIFCSPVNMGVGMISVNKKGVKPANVNEWGKDL